MATNRITVVKGVLTSRLFRQLALALLLVISSVQVLLLVPELQDRERLALLQLVRQARATVLAVNRLASAGVAPADFGALAEQLMPGTLIKGGAIYAVNDTPRHVFGEMPALAPGTEPGYTDRPNTHRTGSGDRYDILWRFTDLKEPYFIAVRLDSSGVAPALAAALETTFVHMIMTVLVVWTATLGVVSLLVLGRLASIRAALSKGDASQIGSSVLSSSNELGTIGWSVRHYVDGKKFKPADGATDPDETVPSSGVGAAATD